MNTLTVSFFWNIAFGAGSFLAALGQGFALGAILQGIAVDEFGHFIGGTWDWLGLRSILVALTLIQGYVLSGSTLLFLLSFLGLGLIIFPYIIPTQITIYQAAASPSSLGFMIIFVGFLIPIMLAYNIYQYVVFRGKVTGGNYGD